MTMPNVSLRRRIPGRRARGGNRRGAALVEVMVAMTVMVLGITGVAGMTVSAGKRASTLTGVGGRTAVQTQVVDQLMVLPYAQLPSKAGCTSVATMPYPHSRCTTVTDVATDRRQITVVFTPTSGYLRADTVVFERGNDAASSPFR
jgi:Tfp pilus assembly protein PilV